jgi:hypothetical protein
MPFPIIVLPAAGLLTILLFALSKKNDGEVQASERVNEDGSKVTQTVKPDGTLEVTKEEPDGTETSVTTEKDGTREIEKVDPDGHSVAIKTAPDGSKTVTETAPDGTNVAVTTQPDGTKEIVKTEVDGSRTLARTDPSGEVITPPTPIPPVAPPQPKKQGVPTMVTPAGVLLLKSPFKSVPSKNWSKFVKVAGKGQVGTITKGARYGLFLFGVRRLADLGLVTNVKRGTYRGQTVWTGTWVAPYSENAFLTSAQLQYRAFIKSCQIYAGKYAAARKQNPNIFIVNGKQLTLSGFLALTHLIGFMGAIDSLKKKTLKAETLAFTAKANGLF